MDQGARQGTTRRQILGALGSVALAAAAPASPPEVDTRAVARNDAALESLLPAQVTDPASPRLGGVADEYRMFSAGSAGGFVETAAAAWIAPQSKHHAAPELLERIRHAAQFLERSQSAEGNIDLLSTNFNSPPDTGFVVHNVGTAAAIAKTVWRGRDPARAAALPGEGSGWHERGRYTYAESSLGGFLGAGAGQRTVSGSRIHTAHRAVAGGGNRYR